ncbi:MAG: hypothetical protein WAX04_06365, partial [Oscillospiraceae bacterium]
MSEKLNTTARYFACLSILLAVYPIVCLLDGYLSRQTALLDTAFLVLVGVLTFSLRDTILHRELNSIWWKLLLTVFIIFSLIITFLFLKINSLVIIIIGSVCIILIGILGLLLTGREPVSMLSRRVLMWITGIDLLGYFLCFVLEYSVNLWLTILFYTFTFFLHFVLRNQANLEELTTRRHYPLEFLPKKIR